MEDVLQWISLAALVVSAGWAFGVIAKEMLALRYDVDRLRRKLRNVAPRDASDWKV